MFQIWKAKVFAILMVVILLIMALPGCIEEEQKEIRFGCTLSLSGKLEESGNLYKEGYEL